MSNNRNNKTNKTKMKSVASLQNLPQEIISIHQFSKIAMTFWIGGSLMIATVILPLLFKTLDVVTASQLAGSILSILAYIGVVCLLIALVEVVVNHKLKLIKTKRFWYILAMGSILIVNYFAIFPMVARFRRQISTVAHQILSVQSNVFDFWHSLSAVTFVSGCILGVLYLIEM
ncbi:MAG: DUF4149 domain-containing protein [Neisseriaceae bacterium]